MVDVPASKVTNSFSNKVLRFSYDTRPHQAEVGVQLIVYGDQHGGENQVTT